MDHILLLESDQELRFAISDLFLSEGFELIQKLDSSDGVISIMQGDPGAILMSEDMPALESVELLPLLRRLTKAPIIVIGDGGETAVVNALLQGADVYLSKPINYRELLSRVRAFFRHSRLGSNSPDSESRFVVVEDDVSSNVRTSLTDIEERLLDCLLEQKGTSVAREELMDTVWGGPVKTERLKFYVQSLRRKLLPESITLVSQNGTGYRLLPLI